MKFSRRNMLGSSAAMLTVVAFPNIAHSQIQSKPSKIVIGFAPGGGTDALARALAEALKTSFSGGIVVDNKAGASGRLAMQAVKAAQPDGTTLLFTPDFTLTVYPHTFSKLGIGMQDADKLWKDGLARNYAFHVIFIRNRKRSLTYIKLSN